MKVSIQRLLRNEAGVSMLQAMVMFGVLVLTGAAIIQATVSSKQSIEKTKTVGSTASLASVGVSTARSMLLDLGDEKKLGICRLFTTPMLSGGTGNIYLALPYTDPFTSDWPRGFDTERWTEVTDRTRCPAARSGYQKCYAPTMNSGITPEVLSKKPVVLVNVVPVHMRNATGRAIAPVLLSTQGAVSVNARDSGLVITATVEYIEDEKTKRSTAYGSIWAGELTCGFTTSTGRYIYLNPSGIGSGIGPGSTLFSTTQVTSLTNEEILEVSFRRYENTRTKIQNNKSISDYSANTVSSNCSEQRYRCRSHTGNREWSDLSLAVEAGVRYLPNSRVASNSIVVQPELQFIRFGSSSGIRPATKYELNFTPIADGSMVTFFTNAKTLTMRVQNSNQVCQQICTYPSFNTSGNTYRPALLATPRSDFAAVGNLGPYLDEDVATYCSCCSVKQCGRGGFRGKVSCADLGPEPEDSRIPECEAGTTSIVYAANAYSNYQTGTLNPNECVAARLSGGRLILDSRACGSTLPPLCFFQGVFKRASTIETPSGAFSEGDFDSAHRLCYQMGLEKLSKQEVDNKLNNQGDSGDIALLAPHVSGSEYRIFNSGTAGLFLAPQSNSQTDSAIARVASPTGQFWVGLRTDANRELYAEPPILNHSFMSDILYYHEATRLRVGRDPNIGTAAGDNLMLLHSRRYFGAMFLAGTSAPVICMNRSTSRYFKSSASATNQTTAQSVCENEGGVYLPPLHPMEWQAALLSVNSTDDKFPWPAGNTVSTAWVGLRRESGRYTLAMAPADGTEKIDYKGVAKTDPADKVACYNRTAKTYTLVDMGTNCNTAGADFTEYAAYDAKNHVMNHGLFKFLAQQQSSGAISNSTIISLIEFSCPPGEVPHPDDASRCGRIVTVYSGSQIGGQCGANIHDLRRCYVSSTGVNGYPQTCYSNLQSHGQCILGYNCPTDAYPSFMGTGNCNGKSWNINNPGPRCEPKNPPSQSHVNCMM